MELSVYSLPCHSLLIAQLNSTHLKIVRKRAVSRPIIPQVRNSTRNDAEGDDLNGNVIGDIYYNINTGGGGYDAAEGCIVVKKPTDDGTVDYTECERRLRTQYYTNIIREAEEAFPDSQSDEVVRMVKADIDFLNQINAFRMKAYFNYSAQEIKKHQIKISNIAKKLDSYYELEMLEWLNRYEAQSDITDVSILEVGMQREKFRRLKHYIYRSFNAPVVLYAFTQLCDFETANIFHIIEGIRYGVDPTFIENNILIC